MRTRLYGLLASASIMLSTAALAGGSPVVLAFFRNFELRVDATLIAANLPSENAQASETVSSLAQGTTDSDQAIKVSNAPSFGSEQAATAVLSIEPQHGHSAMVAENVGGTDSTLGGAEAAVGAVETTGAILRPTIEGEVSSDYEESEVKETLAGSAPLPN